MSKAFTKETDTEEELDEPDPLPSDVKNLVTPGGHLALQNELRALLKEERPRVVEIVSWAAGNGDRSENGDYLYNKKRLREIDRRIRYLTKRLETAEVVDPRQQQGLEKVFFGATVTYANQNGEENTITIVGIDEIDLKRSHISWISPLARALMKSRAGDVVTLRAPGGVEELDVLDIRYVALTVDEFVPTLTAFPVDQKS